MIGLTEVPASAARAMRLYVIDAYIAIFAPGCYAD